MLSKQNIYKVLLTNRSKTPFSRQNQLVNQHEPPFIELRGAHFLLSEATALVEVASPLSEVQITVSNSVLTLLNLYQLHQQIQNNYSRQVLYDAES